MGFWCDSILVESGQTCSSHQLFYILNVEQLLMATSTAPCPNQTKKLTTEAHIVHECDIHQAKLSCH